jgi:hypothetical protein
VTTDQGGRNGEQWIQVANNSQDVTVSLRTESKEKASGAIVWSTLEVTRHPGVRGPMVQRQMSACRTTQSNG